MKLNAILIKLKESSLALLPIMLIVMLLGLTIVPMSWQLIVGFLIACVLLIFGMALFSHGAELSMLPIGEHLGGYISKSGKIWLMLASGFVLGLIITIAEPDLSILAEQVASINKWLFIVLVGVGVGLFMLLGILRIILNIPLNIILAVTYGLIFILAMFVPNQFIPLSFDSGSVTTGPISVPFLMAFGLGFMAVRASKSSSSEQSFGLIALGSAGPILIVILMGLFVDPTSLVDATENAITAPNNLGEIANGFINNLPSHLLQVALVLIPIFGVFLLFQIFALKLPKNEVIRICIGILFVFIGITLFFVGVSVGFLPVGHHIGIYLGESSYIGVLVPVGMILGLAIVLAEPAVHVLASQVEQMTEGAIGRKVILVSICLGVGISLGLCAIRVLCGFSLLYILIPAYAIAIILSFIVPKIFTGIAFDSGGVATGAMATTFVLPLFTGVCYAMGESALLYGFGTLALIAVTPLLTIQTLGLIVKIVNIRKKREEAEEIIGDKRIEIIEFD